MLNTLGGVGTNYAKQMDKQKMVEDNQKVMQKNYEARVHNPAKERLQMEREREAKDFNEVKSRFDKEKMFIDAQKDQAKKLNYMQLAL